MIPLKSFLVETTVKLTREDAQEILHKLTILADNEDLQMDYGLTADQAEELARTVPQQGGDWTIPEWGIVAVQGEITDHVQVLRDIAFDAYNGGQREQALRIAKQAKRLERLFGL